MKGFLLQWFINFLINFSGSSIKIENMSDQQLAEELHKPIIKKLKKKKNTILLYRQYLWC